MQPSPPERGTPQARCRDCGALMWSGGTEQFHVGGASGIWKMMFGELTDLDEAILPLELSACPSCRRLEFRVPERYTGSDENLRGLRYACPACGGDVYQGQPACPACGHVLKE